MPSFQWTKNRIETLKRLHRHGHSYSEIAETMGCGSRSSVGGIIMRLRDKGEIEGEVFQNLAIKKARTSGPSNRQSPGLAHVPLIKARLGEGRNDREIAQELGIKTDDVRYVRRIKGFRAAPQRPNAVTPHAGELKRLALLGQSDAEISRQLGISAYQVRYERRRQNIKAAPKAREAVTTIAKGDPSAKVMAVFSEGFMGQTSRVALIGLELHMCRYPIDQPQGPVRYCGAETEEGQSYCTEHASRCFLAPTPMKTVRPDHVYQARR